MKIKRLLYILIILATLYLFAYMLDCGLPPLEEQESETEYKMYVDIVNEQDSFGIFTNDNPTIEEIENYVNFMKTNFNMPVLKSTLYIDDIPVVECFPNNNDFYYCFYIIGDNVWLR